MVALEEKSVDHQSHERIYPQDTMDTVSVLIFMEISQIVEIFLSKSVGLTNLKTSNFIPRAVNMPLKTALGMKLTSGTVKPRCDYHY